MIFKKLSILFLFLFFTGSVFSQSLGDSILIRNSHKTYPATPVKKQGFNPKVRLSLGSSFSSFAPGYNAFGTYVMPELTIPVNKKFAVRAGIGYSTLFTNYGREGSVFNNKPLSYGTVYVEGIYKLNEKVTVSAMGYKTFNLNPKPVKEQVNPHVLDMSNEGVYLNLNYKVNDKFEINAGFSYDKGNYHPFYSGFGGNAFPMMNPGNFNPAIRGYSPF